MKPEQVTQQGLAQILSKAFNNQPGIATERAWVPFWGKGDVLEGV